MKIALIMTKSFIYSFENRSGLFRYMPDSLTLGVLHSIIKKACPDVIVEIYDETVETIKKENIDADLIGISAITPTINRAYDYAKYFREKGKKVFIGGVHATLNPVEVKEHCDSVTVGLAYETLPELLTDFINNELKEYYYQKKDMSFENLVFPSRQIYEDKNFWSTELNMVHATFGCTNMCGFCVQPYVCGGFHQRPVNDVIEEIMQIKDSYVEFYDPNISKDSEYLKKLCMKLAPLKKQWFAPVTISVCYDEEILSLMQKAGCCEVLIGFESLNQDSVESVNKNFNKVDDYKECIKKLHKHNIKVTASFVLGLEHDNEESFAKILKFVNESNVDFVRYTINTPYPGTPYYEKMKNDGRILETNWDLYDCRHCVFKHNLLKKEEIESGYTFLWEQTYKLKNIMKRLSYIKNPFNFLKEVIVNYIFGKIYIKMVLYKN